MYIITQRPRQIKILFAFAGKNIRLFLQKQNILKVWKKKLVEKEMLPRLHIHMVGSFGSAIRLFLHKQNQIKSLKKQILVERKFSQVYLSIWLSLGL